MPRADFMSTPRQLTMAQWNAMGLRIIKGMKASGRDEAGAALFSEWHTYRPRSFRFEIAGGNTDHGAEDFED